MPLQSTYRERTINELMLMFRSRQINLNPGFQRNSVWSQSDRRRLVQSILARYPLPSIFLYERRQKGSVVYDVIDGKQRLETILMFARQGKFKREAFSTKVNLNGNEDYYDWPLLKRRHPELHHSFLTYMVQTAEVTGDLSDIADLFVKINSTGRPLTSAEKRNARFLKNPVLEAANNLVARNQKYLLAQRILSESQIKRMKGNRVNRGIVDVDSQGRHHQQKDIP
jgi:hypothetical protein